MNHRDVVPLLSDLLSNQVAEPQATEAWGHVASCAECRQAVTAMHEVRAALARRGAEVFDAHPTSREIVEFALDDPGLTPEVRARVEGHLAECPACSEEVLITRRAEAATKSGKGPVSLPGGAIAWLAPALAAVVVALAFPAYVGLIRHPEAVRTQEATRRNLDQLKSEQSLLIRELSARRLADPGGPVRLLVLPATTRGEERVPTVRLSPGQAWQPVIIQHRPFAGPVTGVARAELVRELDGAVVWRTELRVAEAWDEEFGSLTLLVPAFNLDAGAYQLTLDGPGVEPYQGRFQVVRGLP